MLSISGLKNFYFLPTFHDMRCKDPRISEIIRSRYHRDPHSSILPMTVERKNSLFFCSKEGAKASAIFHTIIETCKQLGLSAREYIKNFLKEVSLGRTDWQNLTPAKIYL